MIRAARGRSTMNPSSWRVHVFSGWRSTAGTSRTALAPVLRPLRARAPGSNELPSEREFDPNPLPRRCAARGGLSRAPRCRRDRPVEGADRHEQHCPWVRAARGRVVPGVAHLRCADRDRQDDGAYRHVPRPIFTARARRAGRRGRRIRDGRPRDARRDDDHDHADRRRRRDRRARGTTGCRPGSRRPTTRPAGATRWRSSRRSSRRVSAIVRRRREAGFVGESAHPAR